MTAITEGITVVTGLVGDIFTMISGNPVLAAFVAASLLGSAIGVFSQLKNAAQ